MHFTRCHLFFCPPAGRRCPKRRGLHRLGWLAAAASITLAIGIGWQLRPQAVDAPAIGRDAMLIHQADAMTCEYAAAVRELETVKPAVRETGALQQLDRSAIEVRAALARDPDAIFLLEQLRRVDNHRLSLTRRLVRTSRIPPENPQQAEYGPGSSFEHTYGEGRGEIRLETFPGMRNCGWSDGAFPSLIPGE